MSKKKPISLRAEEELVELLEDAAEELDESRAEVARLAIQAGLPQLEGLPEHVADEAEYESIKREAVPEQREAWFRGNVAGQLWKAWNGDLTPKEAAKYLNGRRKEANRLHEDEELLEYLERGLAAYEAAYDADESSLLKMFTKGRTNTQNAAPEPPSEPDEPDEQEERDPEANREKRIADAVHYLEEGIFELEDVAEDIRGEVAAQIGEDPRGGEQ